MEPNRQKPPSPRRKRRWFARKRFWIPAAVILVLAGYAVYDYYPPLEIPLVGDTCWGVPCLRAEDLVIQGQDDAGHVWATRGMWAYRRWKGDDKFVRQYHVPTGLSAHWTRNFTLVRWLTSRDVCVELIPLPHDGAVAVSAGYVWYRPDGAADFERVHKLRYYGVGVGSGVRPPGFSRLKDGAIMYGEYWRNWEKDSANLYLSDDGGRTWEVAYTFGAGQIRHVHGVQQDPYADRVWVCTGDWEQECLIAWSPDKGKTLEIVGRGGERHQMWRTCQLAFAEDAVFWGGDTGDEDAGIYRWDRKSGQVSKLAYVPGCILYATRLADGTVVMTTDREDADNEADDKTRLWVVPDGKTVRSITMGSYVRPRLFKGFAWLRLPRTQGAQALYVTCLNVTDFNGDLLVVSPDVLKGLAKLVSPSGIP